MKLKLNLQNFQNITFEPIKLATLEEQYIEMLEWVEGWIEYTPFALPLANHIRKILGLQPEVEKKYDKVEKSSGKNNVIKKVLEPVESLPPDSKPLPVVAEVDPTSDEIQYDSKTFKKFQPCKYKCGMFTAWGQPYTQGDRKLHMNPLTKEILGYECPAFDGDGG